MSPLSPLPPLHEEEDKAGRAPLGRVVTIEDDVANPSQRAIIDWKSFNISGDAEVKFIQPGTAASVLNRIYSADPTLIQGKLTANGQVMLINQNGILFDRGTQINVQSLVASSLNITNQPASTKPTTLSRAFHSGCTLATTTATSAKSEATASARWSVALAISKREPRRSA